MGTGMGNGNENLHKAVWSETTWNSQLSSSEIEPGTTRSSTHSSLTLFMSRATKKWGRVYSHDDTRYVPSDSSLPAYIGTYSGQLKEVKSLFELVVWNC